MGFPRDYARAMEGKFGYQVAWPPTASLKLGDYGTVRRSKFRDDDAFDRLGNVADFGLGFDVREGGLTPVESLQSDGVSIVEVTGEAKKSKMAVQVDVSFGSTNSMVYNGSDVRIIEVENQTKLGRELAGLLAEGRWDERWVVVTSLHETNGLTVLLSSARNTTVSIGGSAELSPGNLAKASANVKVESTSNSVANYVSHARTTPLLKARIVRARGFGARESVDSADPLVLFPGQDVLQADDEHDFETVTFDYCDLDELPPS